MMQSKRTIRKKKALSWEVVGHALRSRAAQCAYVVLAGAVILCILFMVAITPQRYDLKVGDIAPTTITASKDVVDEISTARQRESAANQVEPTYVYKDSVADEVMADLASVLAQANAVQQYGRRVLEQFAPGDAKTQATYVFAEAELEYARSLLTQLSLADYQLNTLLRASDQQMADMSENITSAVENTLNTTIREGYVNESIQYLQQIIGYKTDIDLLQNVVTPILRKVIRPNMVIDQEATEKLRDEARAAVEPVIYKQGQNIVLARERVTANQLEMLRSLGMLDDDNVDIMMYVGAALLVLLSIAVLLISMYLFDPDTLQNPRSLIILMLIQCVTLGLCILGQLVHTYMAPVLLSAMMLTGLLSANTGIAGALSMSVLVSALIAGGDTTYGPAMVNLLLTAFISGFLAVAIIRRRPYRQQVLLCGIVTAIVNIVIILTIGFMTNTSVADVFTNALWSAGSALLASVLCIALDPLVEASFHLATPAKLLELSNPNHPLLRRLLIEASGTYHHSIIVANLAEAAGKGPWAATRCWPAPGRISMTSAGSSGPCTSRKTRSATNPEHLALHERRHRHRPHPRRAGHGPAVPTAPGDSGHHRRAPRRHAGDVLLPQGAAGGRRPGRGHRRLPLRRVEAVHSRKRHHHARRHRRGRRAQHARPRPRKSGISSPSSCAASSTTGSWTTPLTLTGHHPHLRGVRHRPLNSVFHERIKYPAISPRRQLLHRRPPRPG